MGERCGLSIPPTLSILLSGSSSSEYLLCALQGSHHCQGTAHGSKVRHLVDLRRALPHIEAHHLRGKGWIALIVKKYGR